MTKRSKKPKWTPLDLSSSGKSYYSPPSAKVSDESSPSSTSPNSSPDKATNKRNRRAANMPLSRADLEAIAKLIDDKQEKVLDWVDSIKDEITGIKDEMSKFATRIDKMENRVNKIDLLVNSMIHSPTRSRMNPVNPAANSAGLNPLEEEVINNINIPLRSDSSGIRVGGIPLSSVRQTVRRVISTELEPLRTLHLLQCSKSNRFMTPVESRIYDRASALKMLQHVYPALTENDIQYVRRDNLSKETFPPVIVGLKDPNTYVLQQQILAGAKKKKLGDRIISAPARSTRPTEQQQMRTLDAYAWADSDTPWCDLPME